MISRIILPVAAVASVTVFWLLSITGSPYRIPASTVLSLALQLMALAAAALRAADRSGRLRLAWGLFALTSLLSAVADALWIQHPKTSEPTLTDALYLASYAVMPVAVLFLPTSPARPGDRIRLGLDLATLLTAASMVTLRFVVGPAAERAGASLATQLATAGYPIADLVLIGAIALIFLRGVPVALRGTLLGILSSVAVLVAGDLVYARQAFEGSYEVGSALDGLWMLGNALFICTAARDRTGSDPDLRVRCQWGQGVGNGLPFLGMMIGFGILVRLAAGGGKPERGLAAGAVLLCTLVAIRQAHLLWENSRLHRDLEEQYDRSECLLLNVLPASIAKRLKTRPGESIAEEFSEATILFADIVGFTPLSASIPPDSLIGILDDVFSRFDALAEKHGLEKIKTIGDAYMAAAGVPAARPDHAEAAARMALAMLAAIDDVNRERGLSLKVRIGLHSGPVVAGVIGKRKFSYDLWGDTVNTASRMESHGLPGTIHASAETRRRIAGSFEFESRGVLQIKGKGPMETWLVRAAAPEGRPE